MDARGDPTILELLLIIIFFLQELSLVVEDEEQDGEGAAAVMLLASSSPAPVCVLNKRPVYILLRPGDICLKDRSIFYSKTG